MQYFAAFEPFDIFEEFNGVQGTYIKSFLISDTVNLNKWQTTHEANIANLDTFLGRPGIHYINPENGKRDHTGATSFEKSLQLQELYRVANIIAVGSDIATKKNWQISKMTDDDIAKKIVSKEIQWISPSIWPDEDAVEIIDHTDGTKIDRVHGYRGLHYAFVDEPAYGVDAEIKSICDGTTKQCQIELQKFTASINNEIDHITELKILPDKNSSKSPANTSLKNISKYKSQMATDEELQKQLEETKKALKATNEELEKLKDEEAKKSKKAQEEDDDEKKQQEAKKAENDDNDDEEKKALKAQVETLTAQAKIPIVDKIIKAQLSASVISHDSESNTRAKLMNASVDSLIETYELIKPFETQLNIVSQSQVTPYMGSDGGAFNAANNDIDDEQLLLEVSQG